MWFLCDIAYAQQSGGAAAPAGAGSAFNMLMIGLLIVVFYMFFIRPQSKKTKEHQSFLGNLKRGDKIVTGSGIYGTIASIDDSKGIIMLEVSKSAQLKMVKSQVSHFQKTDEEKKSQT
jgi:preprotein translocase subunit YajC